MPARTEQAFRDSEGFLGWLAYELAPREGRALAVGHIALACAVTVAIAMVFQIPEPTYMAYIVFLISKDERASTVTSAIGGLAAVTVAIVATLGLSMVDLSEPAMRLPAMAAITFLAMYSVRVFALGPITYLAGFVIVLLQSVVDDLPSPERLTRLTLWVWVMLFIPIAITLVLNLVFGTSVELLRRREFKRILSELARGLLAGRTGVQLERFRERVVELLDKKTHAKGPGKVSSLALQRLLSLLVMLEAASIEELVSHGGVWAVALEEVCSRIDRNPPKDVAPRGTNRVEPGAVRAIGSAIDELRRAVEMPQIAAPEAKSGARTLVVKDATSNPAHWQFALKTTFAVMIVYGLYTLLDWPGMRTSIVTCFFVALGSLGETVHKLTLRISGALIGGTLAGLCIVFVLPHCTDIGQLCLLIALVSAAAGWVATSSEQLAYAGLQIAFAFFLGVLQGYAPATDLTVLRDRVAGILLGNVVITVVFSVLWPQSAATRVRSAVGALLRSLAAVLRAPLESLASNEQAARELVSAEHFRTLRGFELQLMPRHLSVERTVTLLRSLARFEAWVFISARDHGAGHRPEDRRALADWAESAAAAADAGRAWPHEPALTAGHSQTAEAVRGAAARTREASQIVEEAV
ncbi:MAG TPA: FUSC family protein [Steroidobacteraceae bacterium]